MNIENRIINNSPNSDALWRGLGGHFDNATQILCEFIDNSISNIISNKSELKHSSVLITVKEFDYKYHIKIEDTGTGIRNLESCFSLGGSQGQESPLNEHGFGLKHALASADPENKNWKVITRTVDNIQNGQCVEISAPYKISGQECLISYNWDGATTGTIISFDMSSDLFRTVTNTKHRGRNAQTLELLSKYLAEDLGFIYSNIISDGVLTLKIYPIEKDGTKKEPIEVKAVSPQWIHTCSNDERELDGKEEVDLGGGKISISYKFGLVKDCDCKEYPLYYDNSKREETPIQRTYYRTNTSCSGVEIRINGRLLENNLFSEIWSNVDSHNSFNDFLVMINIKSKDRNSLPVTRTSKNGIRQGDSKFEKLKDWIREKYPEVSKVKNENNLSEKMLVDKLIENRESFYLTEGYSKNIDYKIEGQFKVYNKLEDKEAPKADIYIWTQMSDGTIYECKKDISTVKDVSQLRMYWDGCIIDETPIKKAVLVADRHPDSVIKLVEIYNTKCKDINGNSYNFKLEEWGSNHKISKELLKANKR